MASDGERRFQRLLGEFRVVDVVPDGAYLGAVDQGEDRVCGGFGGDDRL